MRFQAGPGSRAAAGALAAAACGLMLTACGSQPAPGTAAPATTTASASASATATPGTLAPASGEACATSQLKVSLSNTGALAGQAGGYLKFTNQSQTPCRMSGWPVVVAVTAAGTATPLQHARSTMFGAWHYTAPPPVMTLKPGDSAYAVVESDNQPAGNSTDCPAPYVRLRVSAPGDSGNVTVSAWLPGARSFLPACTSASGSPTVQTSTITPLASLPH
jgi:Protein of unknown function (DUF4232)